MNAAPAVALPFSSHARLSGAPPRPERPALRLATPNDMPADTPAASLAGPAVTSDTPVRLPRQRPRPLAHPASPPQALPRPARPQATHPQTARPQATHPQIASPRASRPQVAQSQAQLPLRLTRRGRVVVAVLAALVAGVFCLIAASTAQATNHGAASSGTAKVTVRPGQSLWSVAESADPNQDTRLVVQQITELNGLTSQVVYAGEQLWVPRG
jgi:LysM domain